MHPILLFRPVLLLIFRQFSALYYYLALYYYSAGESRLQIKYNKITQIFHFYPFINTFFQNCCFALLQCYHNKYFLITQISFSPEIMQKPLTSFITKHKLDCSVARNRKCRDHFWAAPCAIGAPLI